MALTEQTYSYSPSVNIIRDKGKQLRYIPTYNGQRAFEQIVQSAPIGARAFSLVGAYGSGKSTFLWALAESASSDKKYFEHFDYLLKGFPQNELLDFVGDFTSIVEAFAKTLDCKKEDVLETLIQHADSLKEKGIALIIRIDEFGKFLEFAAKTNPEGEFYFLQQLAEIVNDQQRNIILITTLHQDFAAYAYHLSERQRNEWLKVKGRFKEITFNEPAEQLLLVAADRLADVNFPLDKKLLKELLKAIERAKAFPLKDYFNLEIAEKLSPIEILAGSALTLGLQRYGQNERSLFSFLEAKDYRGLDQFIQKPDANLYNLVNVYDYFIYHYYNQLAVKDNPDFRAWRLMRDSIEKAEGYFDERLTDAVQIIKVIGLLNLFGKASVKIDAEFLTTYCQLVLNQKEPQDIIRQLEQQKIIRFREHNQRFVLFEGTDVDIEYAIDEAGNIVGQIADISKYLNEYFQFPVIPAKRYQIEVGTPRYFEIKVTDEPIKHVAKGERDGFINLIFSSSYTEEQVRQFSAQNDDAILYVYFKDTDRIREGIYQIEKIKQAKAKYNDDKVARQEFDQILSHHQNLLRYAVLDRFFTADRQYVSFFFRGQQITAITSRRTLNSYLSEVVANTYPNTPHFLNEMVNKTKLSAQISTARRNLFKKLVEDAELEDLGYPSHLFPPDKTIYLSLIKDKGIHRLVDGIWQLDHPTDPTFQPVWQVFESFLESAKQSKRSLEELFEELTSKPYKLKRGLVDFLLPLFLLIKRDAFSLYTINNGQERFIPELSADTIDLIVRKPSDFVIKTFSIDGVRLEVFNHYRELLSQAEVDGISNKGFIDTIIPFLTFFKGLPDYAKRTKKIGKDAQRLREAITRATDPEKSFFEDFPQAFGYSITELYEDGDKLETYFNQLRAAIKEIQTSYDTLLDRYEEYITKEALGLESDLPFEEWRDALRKRFATVKNYVLAPYLKTFLQRISSPLDDKRAWMSSVAQVVLGKSIELIQDNEEELLYRKFGEWLHELDNYADIVKETKGERSDEAVKIELTSLKGNPISKVVKVPKSKVKNLTDVEKKIGEGLTEDKNLNIFILTKLLQEQLK